MYKITWQEILDGTIPLLDYMIVKCAISIAIETGTSLETSMAISDESIKDYFREDACKN